jgi:YlmC/YmxH family sporulation protein
MRLCTVNELKEKEVINVCNGRRLGFICNIEIDLNCGQITAIIVPKECKCFTFGKSEEVCIPWCNIEKIGEDTILVKVADLPPKKDGCYDDRCC